MQVFSGVIVKGLGKATTLGFPSINIEHQGEESGVYIGFAELDGRRYPAAVFADTTRGLLEAHLLDFDVERHGGVTGKSTRIVLVEKIHERMHFPNIEDLKANIAKDVEIVRAHFATHPIQDL